MSTLAALGVALGAAGVMAVLILAGSSARERAIARRVDARMAEAVAELEGRRLEQHETHERLELDEAERHELDRRFRAMVGEAFPTPWDGVR